MDWLHESEKYSRQLSEQLKEELAQAWSLPVEALDALVHLGHSSLYGGFFTFPERDSTGRIIGIVTRKRDGSTRSIKGSKRGLTLPDHWEDREGTLFIADGVADTLALNHAGLASIGRPSSSGGYSILSQFLKHVPNTRRIILLGQNDRQPNGEHPGREGTETLAERLARSLKRKIEWTLSPEDYFDVREWLISSDRENVHWIERGQGLSQLLESQAIQAIADETADANAATTQEKPEQKQALDRIVALAKRHYVFFREPSEDGRTFIKLDGRCILLKSSQFLRRLRGLVYRAGGSDDGTLPEKPLPIPGEETFRAAVNTLDAFAYEEGTKAVLFTRVAKLDTSCFELDLHTTEQIQMVKIDAVSWQITQDPQACFVARRGMLPLPVPLRGGELNDLKALLNIGNDNDFRLLLTWMTWSLLPLGPYPILCITGEQGSAKSTTARVIRSLLDPHKMPLRSPPRSEQDLFIAAQNSWVLALDNLSSIPIWLSDGLCRLSTGGGWAGRELYTNDDESIIDAIRPIILTCIEDVAQLARRGDLIDRCLVLQLPSITPEKRQTEAQHRKLLSELSPTVLGSLLSVVVAGLKILPSVELKVQPRMADFARWGAAIAPALGWLDTDFLSTYGCKANEANEQLLEDSPLYAPVQQLLAEGKWIGTASALLSELETLTDEKTKKDPLWPKRANVLSGQLRRLAPALRHAGIELDPDQRDVTRKRRRLIQLSKIIPDSEKPSSTSSTSSTTCTSGLLFKENALIQVSSSPSSKNVVSSSSPSGLLLGGRSVSDSADDQIPIANDCKTGLRTIADDVDDDLHEYPSWYIEDSSSSEEGGRE